MNVRLDILAWLLVPIAVTVLALIWVAFRARPKRPVDAHGGMADLLRFQEAMAKPLPGPDGPVAAGESRPGARSSARPSDGDADQGVA
ncbi:MAG TPA: hypothetical protein VFN19_03635 [Candidatus Nanopelagicales bacterium]|nr:hypothetical protein [Candidatus Nanopelagicales bacterium]